MLAALALRLGLLGQDLRLHPDEALFTTQARLIVYEGDWLLRTTDLDKPPLTIFITAASLALVGDNELAARLPNVLASALTVAAVMALSRALYADRAVSLLAGMLLALSPYDVAFAATTFTDIQATLWALLAVWLAVQGRWATSGTAAALVFACKPTALLALPLIAGLGALANACPGSTRPAIRRGLSRFALPLVLGIGLVTAWDAARAPGSFWALGAARNDPGRFVRAGEVWPRLEAWWHWLGFATGIPLLTGALILLAALWLLRTLRQPGARDTAADWLIAGWLVGALGLYWLVAFNTYDRYLHALIPFLLLLSARAVIGLSRQTPHPTAMQATSALLIVALVLPGALQARRGAAPLGGDQGQHTGIDHLADYLNAELAGAIIYDHWLGWELAYYLGPDPHVQIVYSPLPEALVTDLTRLRSTQRRARYFVAPTADHAARWRATLHPAGIPTTTVYTDQAHGFVVYRFAGS